MLNTNHNLLFKAIILALCVISFVHVFLFPLYGINVGRSTVRNYFDLEQSLCPDMVKKSRIWRPRRCPQYGIVTAVQGGRLGNQMWDYASAWALARRTGLEPYIPRCTKITLDQVFEQLSVPSFEEIGHCPVDINNFVESLESWNYTNQSIVLQKYFWPHELILNWVQDITQEFTIKRKLLQRSQQILRLAIKPLAVKNLTFVGVHVRRTDYLKFVVKRFKTKPADTDFYRSAMSFFERKYKTVVFIMVSDDPRWCWEKFGFKSNVYVTSRHHKNSRALDMAILSSCNHSIIDYGTFGEWGAILAGGETIFYDISNHSIKTFKRFLKNWHTI